MLNYLVCHVAIFYKVLGLRHTKMNETEEFFFVKTFTCRDRGEQSRETR